MSVDPERCYCLGSGLRIKRMSCAGLMCCDSLTAGKYGRLFTGSIYGTVFCDIAECRFSHTTMSSKRFDVASA